MVKSFLRKIYMACMLLRIVGLRLFFRELTRQIYSRHIQIGMERSLETNGNQDSKGCKIKYYFKIGSPEDMNEVSRKITSESKESAADLLFRRWLYDSGFRRWYIARDAETNELCFIQSVIISEDKSLLDGVLKGWFPRLKEDELLLEGAYTFEKYRGNRLCDSVAKDIFEINRKQGLRRAITYIKSENAPSLRAAEKTGFKKYEEVYIRKTLFFTRRHVVEIPQQDQVEKPAYIMPLKC